MPFLSSLKRTLTANSLSVASVPVLIFGLINIDFIAKQQLEGVRDLNMSQARTEGLVRLGFVPMMRFPGDLSNAEVFACLN